MSDFTTPLNALQTQLGGLDKNSDFTIANNAVTFNVTPVDGVAVFDISGAQLATPNASITFTNETSATTIVIDVTGNFA